jgi:uncharacterized protein HemY
MNIILAVIIIALITVIILFLKWALRPLPEWHGLTGEEYKKWKRGERGKSDMSD